MRVRKWVRSVKVIVVVIAIVSCKHKPKSPALENNHHCQFTFTTLPVCHCSGRFCGRQCSLDVPNKIDRTQYTLIRSLISHPTPGPCLSCHYGGKEGGGTGGCTGLASIVVQQRKGKFRQQYGPGHCAFYRVFRLFIRFVLFHFHKIINKHPLLLFVFFLLSHFHQYQTKHFSLFHPSLPLSPTHLPNHNTVRFITMKSILSNHILFLPSFYLQILYSLLL